MDKPEKLVTSCTEDTERRQTKQTNITQKTECTIKNGQTRETSNIGYRGHRTKTKTNKQT